MILKRLSAFLSAGLLVAGLLSVPAYAVDVKVSSLPKLVEMINFANGSGTVETLPVDGLSEVDKARYLQCMDALTGKASGRIPFVQFFNITSNSGVPTVRLLSVDAASFTTSASGSDVNGYANNHIFVAFKYDSDSKRFTYYNSYDGPVSFFFYISNSSSGSIHVWNPTSFALNSKIVQLSDLENLAITDDVEDPEPEPDPPPQPPYVPADPVIPPGNSEYVPYDTSIWKKFLDHVRFNIGSVVSVGLLIFSIIAGVWLIKKIIDYFTK